MLRLVVLAVVALKILQPRLARPVKVTAAALVLSMAPPTCSPRVVVVVARTLQVGPVQRQATPSVATAGRD
jgi:hypothetical protein